MEKSITKKVADFAQPVETERFEKMHLIQYVETDRNCAYCSGPGNRKRAMYVCTGCTDPPHLHSKDCFYKYHTQRK